MRDADDDARKRQTRLAGTVIIAAIVLWFGAQALGGALGLPVRLVFLVDLAAIAAMIWALVVLVRLWRSGQDSGV